MAANDPNQSADTVEQLRRENESLRECLQESSREAELWRAERVVLLEQLKQRDHELASVQHQLQALLRRYYGRSSEKMDPRQQLLFEDMLDKVVPEVPKDADSDAEKPARSGRRGHGRRRLPSSLPREKVIHDLPEEEKSCPCCGKLRHIIGKETHEQLDYIPAKVKVLEHVRLKYGCPRCERDASPAGPQIVTADKPMLPIEKGLAAPGLLSYVIVSKYSDHLPMHRLEGIFRRYGIEIARSTMCDWAGQCAEVLNPLYELMVEEVRASRVIHTDDTPVKVQDRSRTRTRTGRFWVYLGDDDHPYSVFSYTPNRSRDGPMTFLRDWGKDERVYLQADAFGGYDGIYAGEAGGRVTEVACWAHARRKFYDARSSAPEVSAQALAYVRLLYDVEKQAKKSVEAQAKEFAEKQTKQSAEERAKEPVDQQVKESAEERARESAERQSGKTAEKRAQDSAGAQVYASADDPTAWLVSARCRLRQELAVPRLAQFRTWLESQLAERGGPVLPKNPMGQAIRYALNQWDALCVYTTDGRLNIDNNPSENALRRVAVGRKNWLFAGSDNGGRTAATMFSLIATCQRHQVEPMAYLRDVLTRIAAIPVNQLAGLLPDRWQPATPS